MAVATTHLNGSGGNGTLKAADPNSAPRKESVKDVFGQASPLASPVTIDFSALTRFGEIASAERTARNGSDILDLRDQTDRRFIVIFDLHGNGENRKEILNQPVVVGRDGSIGDAVLGDEVSVISAGDIVHDSFDPFVMAPSIALLNEVIHSECRNPRGSLIVPGNHEPTDEKHHCGMKLENTMPDGSVMKATIDQTIYFEESLRAAAPLGKADEVVRIYNTAIHNLPLGIYLPHGIVLAHGGPPISREMALFGRPLTANERAEEGESPYTERDLHDYLKSVEAKLLLTGHTADPTNLSPLFKPFHGLIAGQSCLDSFCYAVLDRGLLEFRYLIREGGMVRQSRAPDLINLAEFHL